MRAIIANTLPDNPLNLMFLLVFVLIFAGVAWYNTRPSRKAAQDAAARLPLND